MDWLPIFLGTWALIASAHYVNLRSRHRRCKAALDRVRHERDHLREQLWKERIGANRR